MNESILLSTISAINQKYDLLYSRTGGYFNIFDIANISDREVAVCRVLYEFLSPSGSHYQGTRYLKSFFEHVLQVSIDDDELNSAVVYREYVIDENRRIDLVIQTSKHFYPIEVKIFAGEQRAQCYDYYLKAKEYEETPILFYLTRYGDAPSEFSATGLTKNNTGYEEIRQISFAEHILNWLKACLSDPETIKTAPIREIILQFSMCIRKFTGKMESEKEMEIKKLLSTAENMRSAVSIQSVLTEVQRDKMHQLFDEIHRRIGANKLDNEFDYEANNNSKLKSYYQKKGSSYPGISYLYKKDVKSGIDIWVRIEIDERLFVGYCCAENGKWEGQLLGNDEIEQFIHRKPVIDGRWMYWEYCVFSGQSESPNFKNFNDAYYKLYEPTGFERAVSYCVDKIKHLLNQ